VKIKIFNLSTNRGHSSTFIFRETKGSKVAFRTKNALFSSFIGALYDFMLACFILSNYVHVFSYLMAGVNFLLKKKSSCKKNLITYRISINIYNYILTLLRN